MYHLIPLKHLDVLCKYAQQNAINWVLQLIKKMLVKSQSLGDCVIRITIYYF
jgi:hypothetical protein